MINGRTKHHLQKRRSQGRYLARGTLALGVCVLCFAVPEVIQAANAPSSYLELRYSHVVDQTTEVSCGAAAIATLLTYFYDTVVAENEMMDLALASMVTRSKTASYEHGVTAYDLRVALAAKGLDSKGFLVEPAALRDYFARGGLPVVIHIAKPERHFEVAVGMIGNQLILADPAWGRSVVQLTWFVETRGYTGVVLVPLPVAGLARCAGARQAEGLNWARDELKALRELREALP